MVRRKTPLLAYCEYVSPDSDSIQVSRARLLLFETIKRVYPKFLKKLSTEVFPLYQELAEAGCTFWGIDGPRHLSPYELITQGSASSAAGHTADTPASMKKRDNLKSALSKWAIEFYADRVWLMDDALRTLQHWYSAPERRQSLSWNPFYGHSASASTGEAFEFRCEWWETELLTWSRYSASVRQRFEETLLEYEKKTRKVAESCGLVRARQKYSPDNFDWFVLYQFAGLSSPKIADQWSRTHEAGVDESTVVKGIKAAAKLIVWDHLRLPQGKRNRKIR
jgi:hypothetical protein